MHGCHIKTNSIGGATPLKASSMWCRWWAPPCPWWGSTRLRTGSSSLTWFYWKWARRRRRKPTLPRDPRPRSHPRYSHSHPDNNNVVHHDATGEGWVMDAKGSYRRKKKDWGRRISSDAFSIIDLPTIKPSLSQQDENIIPCLLRVPARRESSSANPLRTAPDAHLKVACSTFSTAMASRWVQKQSRLTESRGRRRVKSSESMPYLRWTQAQTCVCVDADG